MKTDTSVGVMYLFLKLVTVLSQSDKSLRISSCPKTPLIIDTDASFDVDDVLAICMAHALERRGEAKILAVMHDAGIPEGKDQLSNCDTVIQAIINTVISSVCS